MEAVETLCIDIVDLSQTTKVFDLLADLVSRVPCKIKIDAREDKTIYIKIKCYAFMPGSFYSEIQKLPGIETNIY